MKTQLSLENGYISRGSEVLLEDLSISITPLSALIITGPNGVGKSSLLLSLIGELPLSRGELSYSQINIKELSLKERARFRSYLPPTIDSAFPYSVADFINFGSIPLTMRLSKSEVRNELNRWISYFELEEFSTTKINELSTGQQQRVLLARLFLHNAEVAILDEPTSALDSYFTSLFVEAVNTKMSEGHSFIIASHDFELAQRINGRILELTRGKQKPLLERS